MKQMIIHSNFSEMKNKILPTSLQGNYRDSLGEFSNASYGVFGTEIGPLQMEVTWYKIKNIGRM